MRKVKEYVAEVSAAENKGLAVGRVANAMWSEMNELIETRNVKGSRNIADGLCSILNETDLRWRRFASEVPIANVDGFMLLVRHRTPEMFEAWQDYKNDMRSRAELRQ